MQSRRSFLVGATSAATMLLSISGCTSDATGDYKREQSQLRSHLAANPGMPDLIRIATLAPSGHNTQPWRFTVTKTGVIIRPDFSRRTSVVDPDDHHLFVSLGCAAENLLIAAATAGRLGSLDFSQEQEGQLEINLAQSLPTTDALYPAIFENQSTRSNYDARAISVRDLKLLESTSHIPGVSVIILTDIKKRGEVPEYVLRGNDAQMDNQAFVGELRDWIRFNPSEALRTGDGLFTRCSGQPVIPTWIGRAAFSHFYKKSTEDARNAQQIKTSAGIAIFIGDAADKNHWTKVGRSFQRFALQATALGIRHSLINQPIEVPPVRTEFARFLGCGTMRPDLVVRFGYAPAMPMSMRRPVGDVIVA